MLTKPDQSNVTTPKRYVKPILLKGPVLTNVTAEKPVSGALSSDSTNVCWVARAAFGESDVRWQIFRAWLIEDAPAWFRSLYIRHGEMVGTWLAGREGARRIVRTLMMPAVNRKLRR